MFSMYIWKNIKRRNLIFISLQKALRSMKFNLNKLKNITSRSLITFSFSLSILTSPHKYKKNGLCCIMLMSLSFLKNITKLETQISHISQKIHSAKDWFDSTRTLLTEKIGVKRRIKVEKKVPRAINNF